MLSRPRIPPLTRDEWTADVAAALEPMAARGRLLNVISTIWRHPALARALGGLSGHLMGQSTLAPREREIVILRVAAVARCGYEWSHHERMARAEGLSEAEIRAIAYGSAAQSLAPADALLVQAADELISDHLLGDATWAALAKTHTEQQMMDLVCTVGGYLAFATAANTFGVQLEEAAPV
ncbi:MAG: carboxymuconolactone decarboxylase family protein [Caulobacterales bacterium]|nr:carboxymuconolactone decarboxylase family protein [Caulobacterales bacterium]